MASTRGHGHPPEQEEERAEEEEQIRRRVAMGSKISKFQLEQWLVSAGGVDDRLARRAMMTLVRQGELIERSGMTLQRVCCTGVGHDSKVCMLGTHADCAVLQGQVSVGG